MVSLVKGTRADVVFLTTKMQPAIKLHRGRKRLRVGVEGEPWVFQYVRVGGVGILGPPERVGFVRQGMSQFLKICLLRGDQRVSGKKTNE